MTGTVHVLHVEDDCDFAELVEIYLVREIPDITVHHAENPEEGETILDQEEIDCVVSDYDMPSRTGIEFLESVRATYPNLPFILFTGKGSEEVASEAISMGVSDYLQKRPGTEQYELLANRIVNAVAEYKTKRFEQVAKHDPLTLLNRLFDGFLTLDADWNFTYVNEEAQNIFDTSEEDLLGECIWELFPAATETPFYAKYHEAMEANEPITIEEYFEPWDRWYREHLYPSADGLSVLFRDITDEKARERELKRVKDRYETFIEHSNDIISVIAADGTIRYHSPAIEPILGYGQRELVGENVFEYVHPDDRPNLVERFDATVENPDNHIERVEFRFRHADGDWIWLEAIGSNRTTSEGDEYVINARDVTERKTRESELARLNRRHEMVLSNIRETILVTDEAGNFTYVCPNVRFILGYDKGEVEELGAIQQLFEEPLYDEDRFRQTGELQNVEAEITDREGAVRQVLVTVRRVDIEDGDKLRWHIEEDRTLRIQVGQQRSGTFSDFDGYDGDQTTEVEMEHDTWGVNIE